MKIIPLGGAEISWSPAEDKGLAYLALRSYPSGAPAVTFQVLSADPVEWGLLHRAIGRILDDLQPGVASPLPDDDPQLVDALKVMHEIDRKWGE